MDDQVRELLRDIAEDVPPQREVPPTLRPRARRRIATTVGVTVVLVGALTLGGVAAVRSMIESSLRPADPGPTVELPDDPGAWQRIVLPGGPPGCVDWSCMVRSVAASDAGLVVMGSRFTAGGERFVGWWSHDGLSWHQIESPGAPGADAEEVAVAGPGFVAASNEGVFTSTDGVSWNRAELNPDLRAYVLNVTAGRPGVVAVGEGAWYSADGLTWEPATVPLPVDEGRTTLLWGVAAGMERLVATGSTSLRGNGDRRIATIWVSSDGMSWSDVPIDGDVFPPDCNVTDVAGGPGGFVGVGWCEGEGRSDYFAWRSDDGVDWTRLGEDAFGVETPYRDYLAVTAGPGGFIAAGDRGLWTSVDGESWTRLPTGPAFQGDQPHDVAVWGDRLVVAGITEDDNNVVWISGPQG